MRRFRTTIALAIVAAMIFSLAGLAAAATVKTTAFSDVASDSTAAGAFNVLAGLGVYQGDSGVGGPARPNDPITRLEAAAVVVRLIGKESVARSLSSYAPSFTDANQIPDWGWGYVNVATTLGILKGYPDGSFQPNNNVTHAEMIAMLVRAAELDGAVTGTWPTNYVVYGGSWGITDNVDVFANLPASRSEVAIMAVNTLAVDKDLNEDNKVVDAEPLRERLDSPVALSGRVNNITSDKITIGNETLDLADSVYLSGADSLDAFLNQDVIAYYKTEKSGSSEKKIVVALQIDDKVSVITGTLKKGDAGALGGTIRVDGKNYRLADEVTVIVNGNSVPYNVFRNSVNNDGTAAFDGIKDPTVTLTRDKDDKVVAIRTDYWNVDDQDATSYKTGSDDTEDHTITVGGRTYVVDEDTRLLLNGELASWDDIVDAIKDFKNKWGEANPSASVQTQFSQVSANSNNGKFDTATRPVAVALSVTTDTVDGRVVGASQEGSSKYFVTLRKDGTDTKVEATKDVYDTLKEELDSEVTVSLNRKGVARLIVSEAAGTQKFIARLRAVTLTSSGNYQLTYEFGDGSEAVVSTRAGNNPGELGSDYEVGEANYSGNRGKTPVKLANVGPADVEKMEKFKVDTKTSSYLTLVNTADNNDKRTRPFSSKGVLVKIDSDWEAIGDIEEGDIVTAYAIDGVLWYVEKKAADQPGGPGDSDPGDRTAGSWYPPRQEGSTVVRVNADNSVTFLVPTNGNDAADHWNAVEVKAGDLSELAKVEGFTWDASVGMYGTIDVDVDGDGTLDYVIGREMNGTWSVHDLRNPDNPNLGIYNGTLANAIRHITGSAPDQLNYPNARVLEYDVGIGRVPTVSPGEYTVRSISVTYDGVTFRIFP